MGAEFLGRCRQQVARQWFPITSAFPTKKKNAAPLLFLLLQVGQQKDADPAILILLWGFHHGTTSSLVSTHGPSFVVVLSGPLDHGSTSHGTRILLLAHDCRSDSMDESSDCPIQEK